MFPFDALKLCLIFIIFYIKDVYTQSTAFPVRSLGLSTTSIFTFDLQLQLPLQLSDLNMSLEIDVEVPFRIRFMNHTLEYHAIKIPYFVLPEPKPLTFDLSGGEKKPQKYYHYDYDPYSYDSDIDQYDSNYYDDAPKRSWLSFGTKNNKKSAKKVNGDPDYYRKYEGYGSVSSKKRNDHRTDMFENSGNRKQNFSMSSFRYYHKRHRRDVAAASVQHRMDFFQVIEDTLDLYDLDGHQCLCRAICEMAEMEFLIETPMHEIVEHLLRVSRSNDEEGNLNDYIDAERFGHDSYEKHQFNACSKRYSNCSFSIFNRFHHN